MEALSSSETSVTIHQSTWPNIPEELAFQFKIEIDNFCAVFCWPYLCVRIYVFCATKKYIYAHISLL
jgi:hypothetical protein